MDQRSGFLKWERRFLRMAREVSEWSKDPTTCVGCVIARGNRFVSLGYNGFAAKVDDTAERQTNRDVKLKLTIHAEENAILFASRAALLGATAYTYPFGPCATCMAKLIQVGITKIVTVKCDDDDLLARWADDLGLASQQRKEANVIYRELTPMVLE